MPVDHRMQEIFAGLVGNGNKAACIVPIISQPEPQFAAVEELVDPPAVDNPPGVDGEITVMPAAPTEGMRATPTRSRDQIMQNLNHIAQQVTIREPIGAQ
jgi:hypothetical protein